jgi:uncharacterized membrane protein YqjE
MALKQSVTDTACTLLSVVRTRFELFSLEASGQKVELIKTLGMAFGALLFLTLAVLVITVDIVLYFWPGDHRYLALGLLALFYGLLGVGLLLGIRHKLHHDPIPFAASIDELKRDLQLIERLRDDPDTAARWATPKDLQ